jgi:hypothetical protein
VIEFLAADPRVVVIPVDARQVAALGAKVYPLAADPFKFTEALLISGGGNGYGELGIKLDADHRGYVRVDNRLFKRLFGDFAPARGDLVFSRMGELIGVMVNSDYCALLSSFRPGVNDLHRRRQAGPAYGDAPRLPVGTGHADADRTPIGAGRAYTLLRRSPNCRSLLATRSQPARAMISSDGGSMRTEIPVSHRKKP